ncbi:NAD(P)-dependent oxidoreductase [bacterium]|nr:NAD(P)-dependent oxidoreductase [bacterium]
MKSLITGATGFIGSHLAEALIQKGHDVRCIVRRTSDLTWLKNLPVEFVEGDITDRDSLIPAVQGADYIFHLGGITKAKKESTYFKINADGSRLLYEVCREYNPVVKKIVHVSSQAAAGPSSANRPRTENDPPQPLTYYGKSKLEGEKYAVEYSKFLPITILRPPAVYGPREKDIFIYFKLIDRHWKPILGMKKKYLSLIYVHDLVDAIMLAAENPGGLGQTYFVDDGRIYSWADLSDGIKKVMDRWTLPLFVPETLTVAVAYVSEFFSQFSSKPAVLNRQKIIELRQQAWTTSSEKIRNELGFVSKFDWQRGCEETIKWYRENMWL